MEWIMDRYAYTSDKTSGIVDDPNQYGDEKYIFNLLISIINISLKKQELIDSLPEYKEIGLKERFSVTRFYSKFDMVCFRKLCAGAD
mgnify:CR=1 FL=1